MVIGVRILFITLLLVAHAATAPGVSGALVLCVSDGHVEIELAHEQCPDESGGHGPSLGLVDSPEQPCRDSVIASAEFLLSGRGANGAADADDTAPAPAILVALLPEPPPATSPTRHDTHPVAATRSALRTVVLLI